MAHDVFISHSVKNRITANAVCAMLESNGIRCWIAPRDIVPGMEFAECIIEAIEQTRIMVLVFSAEANVSPQIRREIERAVSHGVTILPMRIEDVLPGKALEYFIGNVHWLDALTPPLEMHLKHLAGTIKILLARLESQGPLVMQTDMDASREGELHRPIHSSPGLHESIQNSPMEQSTESFASSLPGAEGSRSGEDEYSDSESLSGTSAADRFMLFRAWMTSGWTWAWGILPVLLLVVVFVRQRESAPDSGASHGGPAQNGISRNDQRDPIESLSGPKSAAVAPLLPKSESSGGQSLNADATPNPNQKGGKASANDAAEVFASGVDSFRFGDSPAAVSERIFYHPNPEWMSMPIADEFQDVEVRYFFVNASNIPSPTSQSAQFRAMNALQRCWGNDGRIAFLFARGRLIRISFRLLEGCAEREALLSAWARSYEIPAVGVPGHLRYRRVLPTTVLEGHVNRVNVASVEVFERGSPLPAEAWWNRDK